MADLRDIRVMSFNIWRSGGRSLASTTEAIRRASPDVVGLQECSREAAESIAKDLSLHLAHDERKSAILSKHPITDSFATSDIWGGAGAVIDVVVANEAATSTKGIARIAVFNAHLHWDSYGPYHLKQGKTEAFVVEEERRMRMSGLNELLDLVDPFIKANDPTFLLGDFNAPSHLDYATLRWPTSIACYERGLVDSYRVMHPDNRLWDPAVPFAFDEPGITWTPIVEEEPHGAFDRIDFVYFAGPATATSSITFDAPSAATPIGVDPWPSDHRPVLSTFALTA